MSTTGKTDSVSHPPEENAAPQEKRSTATTSAKPTTERTFVRLSFWQSDRVLSPDETVNLVSVTEPDIARRFQSVVANPESSIAYCYLSIFDDCWLTHSRQQALRPESVEACPDFSEERFEN